MKTYICSYNDNDTPNHESEVFVCQADDIDHAREQCQNAYPTAFIAEIYLESEDAQ